MDFDFSPVAVVADATREYRIPALGVMLLVTSLTEANEAYWSATLARAEAVAAAASLDSGLTPDSIAAGRRRDAEIIARYAIRGWWKETAAGRLPHLLTSAGEPVPFSVEAATEWLRALAKHAPHEFTRLRSFLGDTSNWTAGSLAKTLAGNLSGG